MQRGEVARFSSLHAQTYREMSRIVAKKRIILMKQKKPFEPLPPFSLRFLLLPLLVNNHPPGIDDPVDDDPTALHFVVQGSNMPGNCLYRSALCFKFLAKFLF